MVNLVKGAQWAKTLAPIVGICFMLRNYYERGMKRAEGLVALCLLNVIWRLFAHHAGGHRYFAHKSYKCRPFLASLLAVTICVSDFFTFYYWVFLHNEHHTTCDKGEDIHSPHRQSFWAVQFNVGDRASEHYANIQPKVSANSPPDKTLKYKYETDLSWMTLRMNALLFFFEPIFWLLISMPLGFHVADLVLWQCLIARLVTRQGISATNSFAHMYGPRPYCGNGHAPFPDCKATNCWYVALLNGGEGWHNNHHAFSLSARHGLLWWEVDWVWLGLRALAELGVVWDVIEVTEEVRLAKRDPTTVPHFDQKYTVYYKQEKTAS